MRAKSGLGLWSVMMVLGCAAEDVGASASGTSSGGGSSSSGPASTESSGTPVDTSGSSTGGPMPDRIPARGLHVDWVEANQGVGVPIGQNGAWVGPSERLARLLQNRITLIRAFWEIEAGW